MFYKNDSFLNRFHTNYVIESCNDEPKSYEYRKLQESMETERRYFLEMLNDQDSERFVKLLDMYTTDNNEHGRHNFTFGYRLATCLLLDALTDPEGFV